MRAIGFGVGLAAAFGVVAVAAATFDIAAPGHPAPPSTNADCAPGPDFSAAVCRASQADPDAPIATSAFSTVPMATLEARADAASGADQSRIALARISLAQASSTLPAKPSEPRALRALQAPSEMALAGNGPAIAVTSAALAMNRAWTERTGAHAMPVLMTAQNLALSSTLRQKLEDMRYVGHRARVFVFAGDGARVLAYNFTHGEDGMKIAGWSMERTIRLGEQQVGMAWQSGRFQVAVAAIQSKVAQMGVSVKDRVAAISLTFSTDDPDRYHHAQAERD